MKPLVVLIAVFILVLLAMKIVNGEYQVPAAASYATAAMLIFTSAGHFVFTKRMEMMIPSVIPYKKLLVYLTGLIEITAATGLLFTNYNRITAWWLMLFFILLLPANINAAAMHVNFEKATFDGKGIKYLWFRIPLQIFFLLWTYLLIIKLK